MYRNFVSIILAAALAVTSISARPAQAGSEEDIAKWLAGLATLAIIGAAISDNDDNRSKRRYQQGHTQKQIYKQPRKYYQPGYSHGHGHRNGPVVVHKPRHGQAALPASCRRTGNLQGNIVRGFSAQCLQRKGINVQALPSQCAVRFLDRSRDQRVTFFTGPCLHQYGYRLAQG